MSALLAIRALEVEGRRPDGEWMPVVKGVSLEVAPGEVLALIGESGAGKSTIALASMAYARAGCRIVGGEVLFQDENILDYDAERRRRLRGRHIAYVAQSAAAAFNPALVLGEQLIEPALVHGVLSRRAARARLIELARRMQLPDPEHIGDKYPHQVSGGQLQRLMAVMAMLCSPSLLVLDEPTTAIDVTTQVEVLAAFKDVIAESGTAALYVTHDLAVVAQMADRVMVLHAGEGVETGATAAILHAPEAAYTRKLMAAVRPPPKRGEPAARSARAPEKRESAPLLEMRGVVAGYGHGRRGTTVTVLEDVDLVIPHETAVGVIGESGCGKSTLARVIAGLLPAAAGQVLLDGQPLAPEVRRRPREARKRVQLVLQMPDVAFNPKKTVGEALARPLELFLGLGSSARRSRVHELLRMVELPGDYAERYPNELSGGEKQRVNLARALGAEPELVLCDEVTSALDTVVGAAIIALLRELQARLGVSLVFISHDLSTVASLADRIAVLYAGRIAEEGRAAEVLAPPYHPYTRLLLGSVPDLRQGWLDEHRRSAEAMRAMRDTVAIGHAGCPFHTRCPLAIEHICEVERPPVREPVPGHRIACHHPLDRLTLE